MKRCPVCNNQYSDESLRFCLQDGAALVAGNPSTGTGSAVEPDSMPTLHSGSDPTLILPAELRDRSAPTLVFPTNVPSPSEPTLAAPASGAETIRQLRQPTQSGYDRKPRNTALVVALTVMATLIVAAFVAGGAWLLFWREGVRTDASNSPNLNRANDPGPSPSPTGSPNTRETPTPTPTPKVVNATAIRDEVTAVLDAWASAARARDAAANISYYTDTLNPYFNRSSYPASKVRDERARIYEMYKTIDIDLADIKITPGPDGETAIATLDKTWTFEGDAKYSSGSVRAQMWFAKRNGRWLITGEKDLKVYYLNRS
ncbi:MAG: nuclear transport factor 2 family protein [Pyrinomonadaceae bacterium]